MTGGQYSLIRIAFGTWLVVLFLRRIPEPECFAAIPAVFFAIGWFDRVAAVLLCFGRAIALPWAPFDICVLLFHLYAPPRPFLSWGARGRADPDGGWRLKPAALLTVRLALPVAWWAMLTQADVAYSTGFVFLHLIAFDPSWIRGAKPDSKEIMFYDGDCGLCHRSVRFVLAEDRDPDTLQFAPLQGETFAPHKGDDLPDSVVLLEPDGTMLVRSSAILRMLDRLGGYWRVIGAVLRPIPRPVLDALYDGVARIRHRLFAKPAEACPLMPPDVRARFLP